MTLQNRLTDNAVEGCQPHDRIVVLGARVNNLKNIDVVIPRNSLTVITGLSGSGKSSLAFDTIYAEGQRRYIETFSTYARNFIDHFERPDMDKITGLSPVISIEQKTINRNPRSTVGTATEIYDYLRLLMARIGDAYSYATGEKMVKYTSEQLISLILKDFNGHKIYLLAPLVRNRKGHYKELFETERKRGFLNVRIDGKLTEITSGMKLDRYKSHDIELVVDKLKVHDKDLERLKKSVNLCLDRGDGLVMIVDATDEKTRYYSRRLMCPTTSISYKDPAPNNFSFNTAVGACPKCKGLGQISSIDVDKVIPNRSKSIADGAIAPLGKAHNSLIFYKIEALLNNYGYTLNTPVSSISEDVIEEIINGSSEQIRVPADKIHTSTDFFTEFEGIARFIEMSAEREDSASMRKWVEQFATKKTCPECHGARLNKEALCYRINDKNIFEISKMDIRELAEWIDGLEQHLTEKQRKIGHEIIKEISKRVNFLLDVGLDYLSLHRASSTLSGGEGQRIRLATQIGSGLVNVLYILDEPSIGLHERDNERLINSLKKLRDMGNTVIVVEHDRKMMLAADYIVDLGPKAGLAGGNVMFQGTVSQMLKTETLTANYLNEKVSIEIPAARRKAKPGNSIRISGASGNNLKDIDVEIPLGVLVCITGVSGSGKSTLIGDTLLPFLSHRFYGSLREPLPYKEITGYENINKIISVDQSPLGRTPRSNPATYCGVFSDIRNLFATLPEAKIRGYKSGRFSFNTGGGRCEACKGTGYKCIEMNFMPTVYMPCEECHGKRYNHETLEVRYRGKSISDVLDMTINQAVDFFENIPSIRGKIITLKEVGLGYLKLGQSSTTLSGGESQRVKLAAELSKRETGKTMYILDEPTTGLHFEDIRILLSVLNRLVEKGNTVIVIEHNLDVIKQADYVIDMGVGGGAEGGRVVACGTPEQVAASKAGYTSRFLSEELERLKHEQK
jgi:excinuclease ABC subunit A